MKKALIALTILAGVISGAQAGIILSDTFDYSGPSPAPAVDIVGAPGSAWVANSGTTTMQVTNNALFATGARAQDIYRPWQSGPTAYMSNSAAVLYSSYTLHCTYLPNNAGTYFSHFGGTNCFTSSTATITGHRCRVWSSLTNFAGGVAGQGEWYLSIINTGGTATNTVWPTALNTNTTYTIVTRYVVASGESTLWVDPASEASTSVTNQNALPWDWTAGYQGVLWPNAGPLNISFYNFRQASGEGDMNIDNLKVGTSFGDVTGAPTLDADLAPPWNTPRGIALGPITLTVQDDQTPATSLNVNGASSNQGLVANNNILITTVPGTGGTNRSVTITPTAGQQGSTTIYLSVSDGTYNTTNAYLMTVGAPSISSIPNQITSVNTATPAVPFTVSDPEGDTLTFSRASSNPTLVAANSTDIAIGGSGSSRTVTITPEAGQTGVANITIGVNDGYNTVSTTFTVTVSPSLGVIFSEPFNYPDGSLYGATGSPWAHASPSGTNFGQLQVISGEAQLSRSQAEDVAAPPTGAPFTSDMGVVFYTGFKVTFTDLPSNAGNYFLHLKDSDTGTTFRAKVFASTTNAAAGLFRLGVSSSANTPSPQFGRDLSLNQPYIVVTRYNSGTGQTRLWVNPTSPSSPSVDSTDNPLTAQIGSIGLREDTGIGTNYVDNIVISTSFSDVVPTIVQPTLSVVYSGGNVTLNWTDPSGLFALQSATDVAGPYTDVPGFTNPYTTAATAAQYFRLKY
jgi:hypothetical protein